MSHYAVHTPIEPDLRFYRKYKEMGLPEREARYASMVEGMDQSLGDLMDHLEKGEYQEIPLSFSCLTMVD